MFKDLTVKCSTKPSLEEEQLMKAEIDEQKEALQHVLDNPQNHSPEDLAYVAEQLKCLSS